MPIVVQKQNNARAHFHMVEKNINVERTISGEKNWRKIGFDSDQAND